MRKTTTGALRMIQRAAEATEAIATLPTVAASDWPDRAAAVLTTLASPCRVVTLMCTMDANGQVTEAEVAGIASRSAADVARVGVLPEPYADEDRAVQLTIRSRLESLRSFGFRPPEGFFAGDRLSVYAAPLGCFGLNVCASGDDDSGIDDAWSGDERVWNGLGITETVAGIARLSRSHPNRVLVVLVGLMGTAALGRTASDPDDTAMLLEGVLPVLARRAVLAMGHSPSVDGAWLTQREQRVLDLLTLGQSVREIAEALDRSPHTVHDHVKSLHRKFGASSRGELVARALGRLSERERVRLGNDLPGFVTISPPARETLRFATDAGSDRDMHGLKAAIARATDPDSLRRPPALPDRFLTNEAAPAARLAKALHRREG